MNIVTQNISEVARNVKIDFFRGVALLVIFIDHIYNNTLGGYTIRGYGIADAGEIFFFCSGYISMLVYNKAFDRSGFGTIQTRAIRRSLLIYCIHIFAGLLIFLLCLALKNTPEGWRIIEVKQWGGIVGSGFSGFLPVIYLHAQPFLMTILPAYILLSLVTPLAIVLLRYSTTLFVFLTAAVYTYVQFTNFNLPEDIYERWVFNPFAYQFLFAIGMIFAYRGALKTFLVKPRWSWFFISLVVLALVFGLHKLVPFLHKHFDIVVHPSLSLSGLPFTGKINLEPFRILHFLILSYAVLFFYQLLDSQYPRLIKFLSPLAKPIVACGQNSIYIFGAGVVLSYAMSFLISFYGNGAVMLLIANGTGIVILTGFAMGLNLLRGKPGC